MNPLWAWRELWTGGVDSPTVGGKISIGQWAALLLEVLAPISVVITIVRFWVSLLLGIFTSGIVIGIWILAYATFEGVAGFANCRHLKTHKGARDEMFPGESHDSQGAFLTLPMCISFGLARCFGGCIWIALIAGIGWCIKVGYQHLFR